jgi:hypothetical protein
MQATGCSLFWLEQRWDQVEAALADGEALIEVV